MTVADRVILSGMQFFGHHGDVEAERVLGGWLEIDVELALDLRPSGLSDRLQDTVDYAACFEIVREVVEGGQHRLLEAIAESIAARLLGGTRSDLVKVRVAKRPPLRGVLRSCSVVIERARAEAAP